jgi:hypothetical protein
MITTMKQNIKLLFAAGVIGLATSCTDLDVPVKSQYTKYPSSEVAQEAQMADVYYHLRGTLGRRYMEAQALASDEWVSISFDGDYFDSGTYAHTCLHNFYNTDPSIGWYADVASGIAKANRAIVNMGGDDADPKVIAPARAMRAFYHFILMDSYGDIPVLDGIPNENEAIERKPRAEVARFIESELLDIIPYLSEANDETTYGKPNKWMAEALLVKLYINWAVYTAASVDKYDAATATNEKLNDCVKYCDEIIQSGKFSISEGANGYRSKFFPNNGSQIKDFIYAMPFHTTEATGMQYGRPRTWRQAKGSFDSYYGMKLSNSVGGNFSMSPEMSDLFSLPGDERNDNILAGQIYMYDATTYAKTSTPFTYKGENVVLSKDIEFKDKESLNVGKDVHGWCQGYKSVKWFVIDEDFRNGRNQSNDLPIFRYADILLTKAEAITRGAIATNGDTPQSLFNQIRSYVHAPELSHNPSLQELLDERGREFFDENWRRNDMIRFGTFENEYGAHKRDFKTARFEKTCRIFPIPKDVLEQNTNWNQNAGY